MKGEQSIKKKEMRKFRLMRYGVCQIWRGQTKGR